MVNTATLSGDTLTNTGETITIDSGATLTLNGDSITGGTINDGTAAIYVSGNSEIENAALNHGGVTVDSSVTLTLDNDTVSGTTFTDTASGAILSVDAGTTLTLSGTTINGGTINDGTDTSGATIYISGNSEIENAALNHGGVTVDSGVSLTLDNDTVNGTTFTLTGGGSITFDPTVTLEGGADIIGGTMTINSGDKLDIENGHSGGGATLDGVKVTDSGALDVGDVNSGAILSVDDGTTITGRGTMTINAGSTLDVNGGTTTIDISGTITNNGVLEASNGGTLDIVSSINNTSGLLEVTSGGTLFVESNISGGKATIQGGTLQLGEDSNVAVTFDNSQGYGKLIIGDADGDVDNFNGQIYGFSGTAPNSAHSDVVEDEDFAATSYSVQFKSGNEILTLRGADGKVATLTFDGFSGTLVVTSSGGKTYVYDPPAAGAGGDTPSATVNPPVLGAGHAIVPPVTPVAFSGDHAVVPVAIGSANNGSNLLFATSTNSNQGLSLDSGQTRLSTTTFSPGNGHTIDLSKTDGRTIDLSKTGGEQTKCLRLAATMWSFHCPIRQGLATMPSPCRSLWRCLAISP